MPIVNCITDLWWLFYNVHETLTVMVSSMYLFYVSFAGLGFGTAGFDYKTEWLPCFNVQNIKMPLIVFVLMEADAIRQR